MIEHQTQAYLQDDKQIAFRHEFYERATDGQIRDDIVSYLAEYRFEVSEFEYKLGIIDGQLVDPNSQELMTEKARKAIDVRKKNGLNTSREEAELEGLSVLEMQIKENPAGTVVWFSPPGSKEDGYGEYGFGFVGKINGGMLEMTAIRLENPKINDFNEASNALWGENYITAEDFLKTPKVIDVDINIIKEFVHGNFEIRDQKTNEIFRKSLNRLRESINHTARIIQFGTEREKRGALNTLENLALEIKGKFESFLDKQVIFVSDFKLPDFALAMNMQRYSSAPAAVYGSCGMSGKSESSNIFGKLINSNDLLNKDDKKWFSCPKCLYKADGPVGNQCPGCGLTKEDYAQESGEICE